MPIRTHLGSILTGPLSLGVSVGAFAGSAKQQTIRIPSHVIADILCHKLIDNFAVTYCPKTQLSNTGSTLVAGANSTTAPCATSQSQ